MTFKEKLTTISAMLYPLIKPLLFSLTPEKAHELTLSIAKLSPAVGKLTGTIPSERLSVRVGTTQWKSPLGLAAGLDKNAEALSFFAHQGFGALECGTVTLMPQAGNPLPRLFRYPQEESLRNAMGFPNDGLIKIAPRLEAFERNLPIGVNMGKNKDSTPEQSIDELGIILSTVINDADYFVVNVSSPNTPGLRALQEKSYLNELFTELNRLKEGKDLYLKIAPDLEEEKVMELVKMAEEKKLTGIIATNTTIMPERGAGGVSGVLLRERAKKIRQLILRQDTNLELIGVGGITSPQDLFDFWKDGGKVAQAYTSYVYQGPGLIKKFHHDVLGFLDRSGLKSLEEFFALKLSERQKLLS